MTLFLKWRSRWGLIFIFLGMGACAGASASQSTSSGAVAASGGSQSSSRTELVSGVSSWAYQLQDLDADAIGEALFDLVVVDYSSDGSDDAAFSSDDVATMKGDGNTEKLVVAYMSIGEAEDYRTYFDADASYIDAENPDWPGNYKVRYWEDAWQSVIESYVDRLIDAGFDGAYLDIIDAYEYYGPGGESGVDRASAADDMVSFVVRIAEYARVRNEGFLVFPQNGAGIVNDSGEADAYLDAVDGIGVEDTFYYGDEEVDNDLDPQDSVIDSLEAFRDAEKLVLAVDYLTDEDKIGDFYDRAATAGYVPYATVRDLDALMLNDGYEPE